VFTDDLFSSEILKSLNTRFPKFSQKNKYSSIIVLLRLDAKLFFHFKNPIVFILEAAIDYPT